MKPEAAKDEVEVLEEVFRDAVATTKAIAKADPSSLATWFKVCLGGTVMYKSVMTQQEPTAEMLAALTSRFPTAEVFVGHFHEATRRARTARPWSDASLDKVATLTKLSFQIVSLVDVFVSDIQKPELREMVESRMATTLARFQRFIEEATDLFVLVRDHDSEPQEPRDRG